MTYEEKAKITLKVQSVEELRLYNIQDLNSMAIFLLI